MQAVPAASLCEEFRQLRAQFPSDEYSTTDANIVTITNMSPIEPSVRDFELLTLLLHVDVDCYCTVVIDDELHTVNLHKKEEAKYLIDDNRVPDGLIYCARYNTIVRGYNLRPKNRQCINSIAIQSYYSRRNVSVKISSDNIQFCGLTSEEDCEAILEMITSRLNQALSDVEYLKDSESEVRELISGLPDMSFKKDGFYPHIREEWLGDMDDRMREIILRIAIGSRSTSVLKTRLRSVLQYLKKSALPSQVENGGLNIVMMKSSYYLPYLFPFIEFYQYLSTLPGLRYTVQYNPDVIQKMKIFLLRSDNDYQYLDECVEDQLLPYDVCHDDEGTNSSVTTIDEQPFLQIETITIASTFFVNQISFSTEMLLDTKSRFLSIVEDFINNHATYHEERE